MECIKIPIVVGHPFVTRGPTKGFNIRFVNEYVNGLTTIKKITRENKEMFHFSELDGILYIPIFFYTLQDFKNNM